jgi:myo-inositol-1(or 4)-monophosphatase
LRRKDLSKAAKKDNGENTEMSEKTKWVEILTECKNSVQAEIKPLFKALDNPQLDLGVGAGGDPLREIDLTAEKAIVETFKKNEVSFTLISEESGIVSCGENSLGLYVTIDPVDGTTNLMRGLPFYATSIAVSEQPFLHAVEAGIVADLFHGTTYTAERGRGAYRDEERISPSSGMSVEDGLIGLDLNSYRIKKLAPKLTALMAEARHLRHFGANALELCYVADGTIDAFVDIRGKLRTTDIAAASLIISEAGGIITTSEDKPLDARLDPKQKVEFIAAANREVHRRILRLVNADKWTT